jgi:hypothetical protein
LTRNGEELLVPGTVVDGLGRAVARTSVIVEQVIELAFILDGRAA